MRFWFLIVYNLRDMDKERPLTKEKEIIRKL